MTTSKSEPGAHKLKMSEEFAYGLVLGNYIAICRSRGSQIEDMDFVMSMCEKTSKWLIRNDCKPSLIMTGDMGKGKTTMLKAMFNTVKTSGRRFMMISASELPGIVRDYPDTFDMLKSNWFEYLFIDDVGTEDPMTSVYGNKTMPICEIINARYESGLPTIITTNLKFGKLPCEFGDRYGDRTVDRLIEMSNKLTFSGNSYRK